MNSEYKEYNFSDVIKVNRITHDITILVNSCDKYSDVRKLFFAAFDEYWSENKYKIVVNTESSVLINTTNTTNKKNKYNLKWGERLIQVINEIDSNFILMVFDDYILEDYVDEHKIKKIINILQNDPNSSVFYLNAACLNDHDDNPNIDYRLLKNNVNYRLNSVPAIWKKSELLKYTKKNDDPWSWEVFGSYRTFNKKNFYSINSINNPIFPYNNKKGGAVYRGKWIEEVVVDKIAKYKLDIDLNVRGFIKFESNINRSLIWKIKFMSTGFKTVGFKALFFVYFSIISKLKKMSS